MSKEALIQNNYEIKIVNGQVTLVPDQNTTDSFTYTAEQINQLGMTDEEKKQFIDTLIFREEKNITYVDKPLILPVDANNLPTYQLQIIIDNNNEQKLQVQPDASQGWKELNIDSTNITFIEKIAPTNLTIIPPARPTTSSPPAPIGTTFTELMQRKQCEFNGEHGFLLFYVSNDDDKTYNPPTHQRKFVNGYPVLSQDEYEKIIQSSKYLNDYSAENAHKQYFGLAIEQKRQMKASSFMDISEANKQNAHICHLATASTETKIHEMSDDEKDAYANLIVSQYPEIFKKYSNFNPGNLPSNEEFVEMHLGDPSINNGKECIQFGCSHKILEKIKAKQAALRAQAGQQNTTGTTFTPATTDTISPQQQSEGEVSEGNVNVADLFQDNVLQSFQTYFSQTNWTVTPASLKDPSQTDYGAIRAEINNANNNGKVKIKISDDAAFVIEKDRITIPNEVTDKASSYNAAAGTLKAASYQVVQITVPGNDELALQEAATSAIAAGMVPVIKFKDSNGAVSNDEELHKRVLNSIFNEDRNRNNTTSSLRSQYDQLRANVQNDNLSRQIPLVPRASQTQTRNDLFNNTQNNTQPNLFEQVGQEGRGEQEKNIVKINNLLLKQPFQLGEQKFQTLFGAIAADTLYVLMPKKMDQRDHELLVKSTDPVSMFKVLQKKYKINLDKPFKDTFYNNTWDLLNEFFQDDANHAIKDKFLEFDTDKTLFTLLSDTPGDASKPPIFGQAMLGGQYIGDNIIGQALDNVLNYLKSPQNLPRNRG